MPPIDSKFLFQLLRGMCSEVNETTLEYFLMAKCNVVHCLLYGNNNTGESYWPNTTIWAENAKKYLTYDDATFRAAGINQLIDCCPSPDTKITSLEERIADLIDKVFYEFYGGNIEEVKSELIRHLSELDAPKKDIAYIESLSDYRTIAGFLANRVKNKGVPPKKKGKIKKAHKEVKKEYSNFRYRLVPGIPLMVDTKRYIRREDQTKELLRLLAAGDKHIFISAGGGIGKSSFIAEFCHAATDYVPHYCVFQGNIKATIAALNFQGYHDAGKKEDEVYKDKIGLLRELDKNSLLIIDQFEGTEELFDEYYQELETLQIPIIFATRSCFNRPTVVLEPFDERQLLGLIEFYCGNDFVTYHEKDLLSLISLAEQNTLFTDLLGRFFKRNRNGVTPAQLLSSMESGVLDSSLWSTTVDSDYKDRRKLSILNRLEILFDFSFLSKEELYILAAVASHQDNGVSTQEFIRAKKQFFSNVGDVIDDLITKGWLHEKDTVPAHLSNLDERLISQMKAAQLFKRLSVHPLVQMVIINKVNALCGDTAVNWNDLKLFAYASLSGASSTSKVPKQIEIIWDAIDHNAIGWDEYLSFSSRLANALAEGCEAAGIDSTARERILNHYFDGFISLEHDFQQVSDKLKLLLDIWGRVSASFGEDSGKCSKYLEYALNIWQLAMPQETPCLYIINPWFDYKDDQRRCSDIALKYLKQLAQCYQANGQESNSQNLMSIYVFLGQIAKKRHRYEEAVDFFQKAICLINTFEQVDERVVRAIYINLAACLVELNDYNAALESFDHVLASLPADNVEFVYLLSKVVHLCLRNDMKERLGKYIDAICQAPSSETREGVLLLLDPMLRIQQAVSASKASGDTECFDGLSGRAINVISEALIQQYKDHVEFIQELYSEETVELPEELTKSYFLKKGYQEWIRAYLGKSGYSTKSEWILSGFLQIKAQMDAVQSVEIEMLPEFVHVNKERLLVTLRDLLNQSGMNEFDAIITESEIILGEAQYLLNNRDSFTKEGGDLWRTINAEDPSSMDRLLLDMMYNLK